MSISDLPIRIFISHAHSDKDVAEALMEYLLAALPIDPAQIRCTSIAEFALPFDQSIYERLRRDLQECVSLVALLSDEALESTWVKFELGGVWVEKRQVIPILGPGVRAEDMRLGPLSQHPCIAIDDPDAIPALTEASRKMARVLDVRQREGGQIQAQLARFVNTYRDFGAAHASFDQVVCQILSPVSGETVGRNIAVRLRLAGVPTDGSVWVAVEDSFAGRLWPKGTIQIPTHAGEYEIPVIEGGHPSPGALGIVALGVGRSGNARISGWVRKANESGHFPGVKLESIPGAVRLATVGGLILDAGPAY